MGTQYFFEKTKGSISHRGPVIQAGIGPPIRQQLHGGATDVKFELVGALLDTGAGGCMINPKLARHLNLPVHAFGEFSSASHKNVSAKIYIAVLSFPPPLNNIYDFVRFIEAPRDLENHNIVIGRDILARWHIVFDFGEGRYSLSSLAP